MELWKIIVFGKKTSYEIKKDFTENNDWKNTQFSEIVKLRRYWPQL